MPHRIGDPYRPGQTSWHEHTRLHVAPEGVELTIFWQHPSPQEIADVAAGPAEYAWIPRPGLAVLAYRFGDRSWHDCLHHPGADPDSGPPPLHRGGLEVHVVLVDADTGTVAATRAITWPPPFAKAVALALAELTAAGWHPDSYQAAVDDLFAAHPDTGELLAATDPVRCRIPGAAAANTP